jgi:hypothetical protein
MPQYKKSNFIVPHRIDHLRKVTISFRIVFPHQQCVGFLLIILQDGNFSEANFEILAH